jgi:hypothetical protein
MIIIQSVINKLLQTYTNYPTKRCPNRRVRVWENKRFRNFQQMIVKSRQISKKIGFKILSRNELFDVRLLRLLII